VSSSRSRLFLGVAGTGFLLTAAVGRSGGMAFTGALLFAVPGAVAVAAAVLRPKEPIGAWLTLLALLTLPTALVYSVFAVAGSGA
jgi:hypothetical protein